MSEQRCKTCKHWRPNCSTRPRWHDPCGACVECRQRARGMCRRSEAEDRKPKTDDTLMWGDDASGYWAIASTLPDFGCVMWEPSL